jgi:hypothetical protein
MLNRKGVKYLLVLTALMAVALTVEAQSRKYHVELGLQGGCGYYVGDATTHIFNNVREVYGGHVRYKFDQRWAMQVKGLYQFIKGPIIEREITPDGKPKEVNLGEWTDDLINLDVMAEFNFFRFGIDDYDRRVKPITPYIFAGIGMGIYGMRFQKVACYFPFGFGMKWKFAPRWGLNLAWQHNLYFTDSLEGTEGYGNTYDLNGSNILNFDLTGQLTLGIVFEFAREKKICRLCYDN